MYIRVVEGRAEVVREIRAAAPLFAELDAPTTARGAWLAAALHAAPAPAPAPRVRHRAVVVEHHQQGRPAGAALLTSRTVFRRGRRTTVVRLLGDDGPPPPPGGAPRRLAAADDQVAGALAEGIADLLATVRGPWELELTGLPMGDPVLRALAARLGTGAGFRTTRTRALADRLDAVGSVTRSTAAADLERWLPLFLDHRPDGARRAGLRATARVHAAAGVLEHAVVGTGEVPTAGLLTVLDRGVRRPWWGFDLSSAGGAAGTVPAAPSVSLCASSRTVSR